MSMVSGIDENKMTLRRRLQCWPVVGLTYTGVLLGGWIWWMLQSAAERSWVLSASSTDLHNLLRVPWLVLPASSIWSGNLIAYWAVTVLVCLGALERIHGARSTLVIGVGAHVVSTVVSEGITAVRIAAGDLSASAGHLLDVGPSYIVAACAAAVVASRVTSRWWRLACGSTLVPLVVMAFADLSDAGQVAAIGHAVAMLLGACAGRWRLRQCAPEALPAT
jgi:hypothetical protein